MGLQTRTLVGAKGRIVIPVEMREALGIDEGDKVTLQVENHELHISTRRGRIRRAQERAAKYVKPGTLVSDELSAERREAAKHE
jgi:AbrB family looped-hinge helix DNA binding protein